MAANTTVNLVVNQKASFRVVLICKTDDGEIMDLTGYTVAAAFKTDYDTPDSEKVDFDAEIVDAEAGEVAIGLTPEVTAELLLQRYVYDVTLTSSEGFKTRVMEGLMRVSGGVS